MSEKDFHDDANRIEESSEEEMQEYESEGREESFVSEDDVDGFDVKDELDDFEEELGQDMSYLTSGRKPGFFSKLFKMPLMPAGWIGVLLVILIILFLFLPRPDRQADKNEISTINQRINNLEGQLVNIESLAKRVDLLSVDMQLQNQLVTRLDKLEKNLTALTGQFQKQVEDINKRAVATKPARAVVKSGEKKQEKQPAKQAVKPASKPTDEKFHVVKQGENLYRISLRYGLTEAQLGELNNLKPNAIIYPGQKLKVGR